MRFITRPPRPEGLGTGAPETAAALAHGVGRFCAICEKALTYQLALFHKTAGPVPPEASVNAQEWSNLLLVCGDCMANLASPAPSGPYLWPDEDAARAMPMEYRRYDNVLERVVGEGGVERKRAQTSQVLVRVRGNLARDVAQAAANTLALFRLNGTFFNGDFQSPALTYGPDAPLQPPDLRLEQRWDAYLRGVEAAEALAGAFTTTLAGRSYTRRTLRMISAAWRRFGYFSSWEAGIVDELNRRNPDLVLLLVRFLAPRSTEPEQPLNRPRLHSELADDFENPDPDLSKRRATEALMQRLLEAH